MSIIDGYMSYITTMKEVSTMRDGIHPEYNEVKDKLKTIVAKLGLEMNTKDADVGLNEIEEEIK